MLKTMLSLFFPSLCLGCEGELTGGKKYFCAECAAPTLYENGPLTETAVAQKLWGRLPLTGGVALWSFLPGGNTQQILHRLKYENQPRACIHAGRLLGKHVMSLVGKTLPWDAIAYVPMHPAKERQRGYNQAEKIAEGLSKELGLPVLSALAKKYKTESQTRLGRLARWKNARKAFRRKQEELTLNGRSILLVDDVITTGATLEAAAGPLLEAKVKGIGIAVLANVL